MRFNTFSFSKLCNLLIFFPGGFGSSEDDGFGGFGDDDGGFGAFGDDDGGFGAFGDDNDGFGDDSEDNVEEESDQTGFGGTTKAEKVDKLFKPPKDSEWEALVKPKAEFVDCKCNWGLFRDRNITMRKPLRIETGENDLSLKGIPTFTKKGPGRVLKGSSKGHQRGPQRGPERGPEGAKGGPERGPEG